MVMGMRIFEPGGWAIWGYMGTVPNSSFATSLLAQKIKAQWSN